MKPLKPTVFLLLLLFSFLINNSIIAQKVLLRGMVVDDAGVPIPYSTIMMKEISNATMADINGHFALRINLGSDTIIRCTHVGYVDLFQKIVGNNYLVLSMKPNPDHVNLPLIADTVVYSKKDLPPIEMTASDKYLDSLLDSQADRIFTRVEIYPGFPGGNKELAKYIKSKLVFSDSAYNSTTKGSIKVGFIIANDGTIKNVRLLSGINKYYDDAVLKIIAGMPNWQPALQNGRRVNFYKELSIPINVVIVVR